jgi:hypothetical protein
MRDSDGDLIVACGDADHNWEVTPPRVVGLGHMLERDLRLHHLNLELGVEANLIGEDWIVSKTPESETNE